MRQERNSINHRHPILAAAEEEQRLLAEAKAAGTSVSAFAKAKMHEARSPQP